jgi:hypothetical protein
MVAYLKTDTVILADLGDRGTYHEAEWMLSNWTERIVGNGYVLIYAGLVNVECKPMVENAVDEVAKAAGLRVERSAEWSG